LFFAFFALICFSSGFIPIENFDLEDEMELDWEYEIPRDQLENFDLDSREDDEHYHGIPPNVRCNKTTVCGRFGVCTAVCEPGTVELDEWLLFALKTQRKLAYSSPFCYSQLPGSLNSAITIANGYGARDRNFEKLLRLVRWISRRTRVQTNDQYFSLTDQLNMGVRQLELDVHWVYGDLRISNCGGFKLRFIDLIVRFLNKLAKQVGWSIRWDTSTIGCVPSLSSLPASEQRTLEDSFQEIKIWLDKSENQNEFMILYLDDLPNLLEWNKVSRLTDLVEEYFGDRLFRFSDYHETGWKLSINDMIKKGKQVLVTSRTDYGEQMKESIFARDDVCDMSELNPVSFNPFPNCSFDGRRTDKGKLIRVSASELMYGPVNSKGEWGENDFVLDETNIKDFVNCNVNLLSPARVEPRKMEAQIWTWAPGEPKIQSGSDCTALDLNLERWITVNCSESLPPACKNSASGIPSIDRDGLDWSFGSPRSGINRTGCPQGYRFKPPMNGFENSALLEEMRKTGQQRVWINYNVTAQIPN